MLKFMTSEIAKKKEEGGEQLLTRMAAGVNNEGF